MIGREQMTFYDVRHAIAGMVERDQHATLACRSRLAESMSKLAEL